MGNAPGRLAHHLAPAAKQLAPRHRLVGSHRTHDNDAVGALSDLRKLRDPLQADQGRRPEGRPHVHPSHEGLPAGKAAGIGDRC